MFTRLDGTNLRQEVVELLLGLVVFLGHFLVLGLPLIALLLQRLHLALIMT